MKTYSHGQEKPPLAWEPVPGLEVRDSNFVEWLLAGGTTCPGYLDHAWADTAPATLRGE